MSGRGKPDLVKGKDESKSTVLSGFRGRGREKWRVRVG